MKRTVFLVILTIFATLLIATTYAKDDSAREKFIKSYINKSSLDLMKYRKPRVPASPHELGLKIGHIDRLLSDKDTMPEGFWVPAEFNESQAVLISWPSMAYDSAGNYLDPYMNGMGVGFDEFSGHAYLATIEGYVLDLFDNSYYRGIWANLADAIQHECVALIRVSAPQDTTQLKDYMASLGTPLFNYRFITDPAGENAFWTRDFAPYGFYHGEGDTLALLDATYYPGRPNDDRFADYLGDVLGLKVFHSPLETEGGNFMTDGFGNIVMSDVVYYNNMDEWGYAGSTVDPMTAAEVREEIKRIYGVKNLNLLPHLKFDGGTGHIDIYLKMTDENSILTTEYPESFNSPKFPDYFTAQYNVQKLMNNSAAYGKPVSFNKLPMPTYDDGSYPADSSQLNADDRGYINGLLINKTFIYPTYHNSLNGNAALDEQANETLKKYLPGYKLVPIDSRILTPSGGAIHCITMQIPAANPIRLSHSPIVGKAYFENNPRFVATAINAHGIDSVLLKYRIKGGLEWNVVTFDQMGIANGYSVALPNDIKPMNTVEYYVEAWAKGKSERRPYTAPEGFYTFNLVPLTSAFEGSITTYIGVSPNPAWGIAQVKSPFEGTSELTIIDMQGSSLLTRKGAGTIKFDCATLPEGMYFIKITDGKSLAIGKFVVVK